MKVQSLLKELIDIPSVSGEEKMVGENIYNYLQDNNFNPVKMDLGDGTFNVYAVVGNPKVFFSAHMDTVPPFIKASEDAENIYGRGSCDTKGSIATMVMAGIEAKNAGLTDFGLMFTVREETDFAGVLKVVDTKLDTPFVVVGEPTSLDIVEAHFGIQVIKVIAKGVAAHSSRPEDGDNAIDKLLADLEIIKQANFLHPTSLISIVLLNGGVASNVVPAHAEATISIRIAPDDKNDYFKIISDLVKNTTVINDLFIPSVQGVIPKCLDFITNRRTVRYCTELSYFKNGIVFGPGDIKYAHGVDEYIKKSELDEAVELYKKIISAFQC